MAVIAAMIAMIAWSITPVPFNYADIDKNIIIFGTTSQVLPIIRIANELLHPLRRALVPLELENLKRGAIATIGYDDFGTLCDWKALEKFVEVADKRAHLLGRLGMKDMISRTLMMYLTLSKMVHEHPEILDEKIDSPIFLSTCARAGSTFLYQVLADTFDQELTANYFYETVGGPVELPDFPWKEYTAEKFEQLSVINPPLMLLHEFTTPEDPDEDAGWYKDTMRGIVTPLVMPSMWHHANVYQESSAEMNKNFWEMALKVKQWKSGKRQRFMLKAPEHLLGLPYLSENFPDAKFVTVRRNETNMYKSGIALAHKVQEMFVHPKINETLSFMDLIICHERKALEVASQEKYDSKVMHVRFEDGLFTNTFDIVSKFAEHTNLPWDDAKQEHARIVIAKRLAWKNHRSKYQISDFGFDDEDRITERLSTICEDLPETVQGLEEFYNLKP